MEPSNNSFHNLMYTTLKFKYSWQYFEIWIVTNFNLLILIFYHLQNTIDTHNTKLENQFLLKRIFTIWLPQCYGLPFSCFYFYFSCTISFNPYT